MLYNASMATLISVKNGKRLTFIGLGIVVVGFIMELADAFNVYDNASSCLTNSSLCDLSPNLLVIHIGSWVYRVGIAMTVVGLLILIIKRRSKS